MSVFLLAVSSLVQPKNFKKSDSMEDFAIKENIELQDKQMIEDSMIKENESIRSKKNMFPYVIQQWVKNQIPLISYAEMGDYYRENYDIWMNQALVDTFPMMTYAVKDHNDFSSAFTKQQEVKKNHEIEEGYQGDGLEEDVVSGEIGRISGETYYEELDKIEVIADHEDDQKKIGIKNQVLIEQLQEKRTTEYLVQNFFIVDTTTVIDRNVFQVDKLLSKDFTMEKKAKPQILIYHTHGASEAFSDSKKGKVEDSIIGVGEILTEILEKEYGYHVIHDTTPHDLINGKIDRNKGYNQALTALEKTLKRYPTIEVMIDLHRDAGSKKRVTIIDGKPTAQVMFFNGLSRNLNGSISYLFNENLQGNLAFSLQMKMKAMEQYPDFTKKIYLKGYRYNLHLREKSLLIELGTVSNTVEEAKNAMKPLADVLDSVLNGS